MRPALLYLLVFVAIATAFVKLSPESTRQANGIPPESLARYHASAYTTRISFTSEAVPADYARRLEAVANLQQPALEDSLAAGRSLAAATTLEVEGTH